MTRVTLHRQLSRMGPERLFLRLLLVMCAGASLLLLLLYLGISPWTQSRAGASVTGIIPGHLIVTVPPPQKEEDASDDTGNGDDLELLQTMERLLGVKKKQQNQQQQQQQQFQQLPQSHHEVTKGFRDDRRFNPPNCSLLEFLAKPDPSVWRAYNESLVCGEDARDRDVFCRLFFMQNGLKEDGNCVRDSDDTQVPRIVYYVIFGHYTFTFLHYVSVMAAKRHVRRASIYVIGDSHPLGYWWERVLQDCPGVRFVYRPCPGDINGQRPIFAHHWSDIVRLQALLLNGGIYLDADMVMVRDPGPLLEHDITMGMVANVTGLGNAFLTVKRNSDFVLQWYASYDSYSNRTDRYFYNSLRVPMLMWQENPSRVHMETDRLYRPNFNEADKLFKGWDYDWRQNYAVHVWTEGNPVPKTELEIEASNTTVAQVFRNALHGDPRPRPRSRRSPRVVSGGGGGGSGSCGGGGGG